MASSKSTASPPGRRVAPERRLVVGIAALAAASDPELTLAAVSVGSGVAVCIYDPVVGVGGMLHAMLPDSGIAEDRARVQPGMFLDSGLPCLLDSVAQLHLKLSRAVICVVGGAEIMDSREPMSIGRRNVEALRALLQKHHLTIAAEHLGETLNRTLSLRLGTGDVRLRVSGHTNELTLWQPT